MMSGMNPTDKFLSYILSILSLFRVLLQSRLFTNKLPKTDSYSICILANGPSLAQLDVNKIIGEVMVVNNFSSHSNFEILKPKYYILNAPEYWLNDVDEEYISMQNILIQNLSNVVKWKMFLLVPYSAKNTHLHNIISAQNPNIEFKFYNTTPIEGLRGLTNWMFAKQLGMPRPHNVLIPALMTSSWMNYKNIFIYGADHSWLKEIFVDNDNNVFVTQKHFYDKNDIKPATMKKLGKGKRRLHEILEKFYLSFKGYHVINDFAKSRDVRIVNKTPDSFIDAFDRN